MWDLNDSPDPMRDADSRSDNDEEEEENSSPENAATDNKGKEPESASTADNDDSGSSVLVAEASNEVDGDGCRRRRRPLLRAEGPLLRAHWVGVKFCQSSKTAAAGKPMEASQPMKKSRRGPRSRSSQYRGVNPGARSTGEGPGPGVQQCRRDLRSLSLFLSNSSITKPSYTGLLHFLPHDRRPIFNRSGGGGVGGTGSKGGEQGTESGGAGNRETGNG